MIAALIDVFIVVLLAGSIAYGYLVSRKVQKLMLALKDLEPLVEAYAEAVEKSETSVNLMRSHVAAAETAKPREDDDSSTRSQDSSLFRTRRTPSDERLGIQSLSNKTELVRSFFEHTRIERRA